MTTHAPTPPTRSASNATPYATASATGPDTDGSLRSETETLGYLDARLLLSGFAHAAAKACRDGVPVRRLADSTSLYQLTGRPATAAASATTRLEILTTKVADLDRRISRAKAIVMSTTDQDKVADYSAEEDRLRSQRRAVQAQLAQLEQQPDKRAATAPEGPFRTYNEVVATALKNLARGPKKVTQAQYEALQTVMPELALRRDDNGIWHAAATLRLGTTDDTVVDIGPIRWRVGAAGRGTVSVADRSFSYTEREPRAVLVSRLGEAGTLTRTALMALMNAPFPELPYVVLHGLADHPFPDWVGPAWREQPFIDWITSLYANPDFRWATLGRYTTFSPERQLLLHLCAEHELVDPTLLRTHNPYQPVSDYRRVASTVRSRGAIPPWEPCVNVVPQKGRRLMDGTVYTGVRCECGRVARVVARVPEVPRSLLCECGRMPDAQRHGMAEDVRFPPDYAQVLMLSMQRCQALIEDKLIRSPQTPSAVLVTMMRHVEDIAVGLTASKLCERTGLAPSQVRPVLHRLAARGFLRTAQYGGVWEVLDVDGLRAYATHVLTDERTPIGSEKYRRPDDELLEGTEVERPAVAGPGD